MSESYKQEISSIKTNAQIRSFQNLSFQSDIEYLNLSNNLFFDFIGFQPPKKLKALIMNDNPILSFEGFPEGEATSLEEISLINCPISKLGNFRSLCLIVIGRQLKMINGIKVTRNDQNIALRFGSEMGTSDSKIIRFLLTSGWLPKRSAILDNDSLNSILSSLEKQKNDPISLKAVSKLREIGYSKPEIKKIIRSYFSPDSTNEKLKKKNNSILYEKTQLDPIETQLRKQQELINTLSVQIQFLRNGNKSFNAYDEMIKTIGAPLVANAKIVGNLKTNKQNSETNSNTTTHSKQKEDDDYQELRKAVIEFVKPFSDEQDLIDDSIDDNTLIEKLSEFIPGNDEEDQNEENNEENQNEENNEEDQNEENNEEDQNEENSSNEEEES